MTDPLLTIRNNHSPSCGDPPILNNSADCYVGYFENVHGEQWVFTYDRLTKTATLRGGESGWNTVYKVRDGEVPELVLNKNEIGWLRACWNSAVAR